MKEKKKSGEMKNEHGQFSFELRYNCFHDCFYVFDSSGAGFKVWGKSIELCHPA